MRELIHLGTLLSVITPSLCSGCAKPADGSALAASRAQERTQNPAVITTAKPADLAADARLTAPVSFTAKSKPLEECLPEMAQGTSVRLFVDKRISHRRLSLMVKSCKLRDLMAATAAVMNLAWRTSETADYDYELYQTQEARQDEAARVAASARREEQAEEMRRMALLKALEQALAGRSDKKPSFADRLSDFSPDDLRRMAELASEPTGVISTDNPHYSNRVFTSRPFGELSPNTQARVLMLLGNPGYAPDASGSRLATPADVAGDLAQCQVGIVAADGGVRLAVIGPDGHIWVSPFDAIQRRGLPGIDSDNDTPPEVTEALQKGRLLNLDEMPHALRFGKRLRFPSSLNRTSLPDVLESIANQTGIPFVADDFLRSRQTTYGWLLTDQDDYKLDEALKQVAGAFGHRFVYKDGVMRVQTVSPGLDLRAEPPAELLTHLRERTKKNEPLLAPDYLDLARLTRLQLFTLMTAHIPEIRQGKALFAVQKMHGVLAFYAGLSGEDRAKAESGEGLTLNAMDMKQKAAFMRLAGVGLPARIPESDRPRRSGLYVQRVGTRDGAETITFLIVGTGSKPRVTAYRLVIP